MTRLLGIDATKNTVRIAVLRASYRKLTLEALKETSVLEHGSETEAIRAAVAAASIGRAEAAATSLSGERSFYRRLDLPAAAQKEIDNVLGFELEATVPFEMEDAVFDYRVLRRGPNDGPETVPVMCVIARTDDVRERIAPARDALGFEPERVGSGPLPLANLGLVMPELDKPRSEGPVALLDIDETTSDLIILAGGEPTFVRTLSRGTAGLPDTAPALARELRQTLAAWRNQGGEPLSGLYLVGLGSTAQGAEAFLAGELGVEILPLPTPHLEGITEEQTPLLPRFAKAIGTALGLHARARGMNLRRGPLAAERSYAFVREKIPLLAGLSAVIAVSFIFSMVAQMRTLDAERELLTAKLAVATRDVLGEEINDPEKAKSMLDQGPGKGDEDPMPQVDAFDVMVALSKAVPKEVVHDVVDFDVSRGHATIQGIVPSVGDAETISKNLKDNNKCLKDVKIARTSQFAEGKQKYVFEFDVKCEEKKKKPAAGAAAADSAQPEAPRTEGGE